MAFNSQFSATVMAIFKGQLKGANLGLFPALLCFLLVISRMPGACNAMSVVTEKWREPCYPSSSSTDDNTTVIMRYLKLATHDVVHEAGSLKTMLTSGDTVRVGSARATELDNLNAHVSTFPLDVSADFSSQSNITELLTEDYNVLSKIYIFIDQCWINSDECDQGANLTDILAKMRSLQSKILSALCQVDKYLTASGHPMPEDRIPEKSDVVDNANPNIEMAAQCASTGNDVELRNDVDYIIVRDTTDVTGRLYSRYTSMYSSMS